MKHLLCIRACCIRHQAYTRAAPVIEHLRVLRLSSTPALHLRVQDWNAARITRPYLFCPSGQVNLELCSDGLLPWFCPTPANRHTPSPGHACFVQVGSHPGGGQKSALWGKAAQGQGPESLIQAQCRRNDRVLYVCLYGQRSREWCISRTG
eukprot:1143120-Pelagomonas_calceolata.AAC.3